MDKRQLELYTDYLNSNYGYATATGLSAMANGAVSHDKITRFLSEREYTSKELWREVKSAVRKIESGDGVLIFDDTISEKMWTDDDCRRVQTEVLENAAPFESFRLARKAIDDGDPASLCATSGATRCVRSVTDRQCQLMFVRIVGNRFGDMGFEMFGHIATETPGYIAGDDAVPLPTTAAHAS